MPVPNVMKMLGPSDRTGFHHSPRILVCLLGDKKHLDKFKKLIKYIRCVTIRFLMSSNKRMLHCGELKLIKSEKSQVVMIH